MPSTDDRYEHKQDRDKTDDATIPHTHTDDCRLRPDHEGRPAAWGLHPLVEEFRGQLAERRRRSQLAVSLIPKPRKTKAAS